MLDTVWAGRGLEMSWARVGMGWRVHRIGWEFAVLGIRWAGHCLAWARIGNSVCCVWTVYCRAGNVLDWVWAGLGMGRAGNGLFGHWLGMGWSGHGLVMGWAWS
jgi:hypothetical protein